MRWAAKEDRISKRRNYCEQVLGECKRVIERIEQSWGYFHTSKRTAGPAHLRWVRVHARMCGGCLK